VVECARRREHFLRHPLFIYIVAYLLSIEKAQHRHNNACGKLNNLLKHSFSIQTGTPDFFLAAAVSGGWPIIKNSAIFTKMVGDHQEDVESLKAALSSLGSFVVFPSVGKINVRLDVQIMVAKTKPTDIENIKVQYRQLC
jgi:hypothetical protein